MSTPSDGAAAVKGAREARLRPPRSVCILIPPCPETKGWFAVRIRVGSASAVYLLCEIPCEIGGIAFTCEKLDDALNTVEQHHVRIGAPRQCSCECKGFLRWSRCKHLSALGALQADGQLPRLKQKHAACPLCQAYVDAPGLCPRCADEEEAFAAYFQAEQLEQTGADDPAE